MPKFRLLEPDEIEVRVARVTPKMVSVLLYKNARVDMQILDETVGSEHWQRRHTRDNANCIVSIWNSELNLWVEKEDTGVESNTEKEKGLASDSFKRACTNWGIGRELYTAPNIFIDKGRLNIYNNKGKEATSDVFRVSEIAYDEKKRIKALKIEASNYGNGQWREVYRFPAVPQQTRATPPPPQNQPQVQQAQPSTNEQRMEIIRLVSETHSDMNRLLACYRVQSLEQMNAAAANHCINTLRGKLGA